MPLKRIGEILVARRLITEVQLNECLEEQRLTREYLGAILLKKKLISEEDLMKALSIRFDLPYVSLKVLYIDWAIVSRFTSIILTGQKVFPFREDGGSLVTAVSDPLDAIAISKFEEAAKPKNIKLVLVSPAELKECMEECRKRSRGSLKHLLEAEGDDVK